MMYAHTISVVLCMLVLASTTIAAVSKQCLPAANVCFSLHIPNTTVISGHGDIHMQILAPISFSWVALGQGTNFTNANLFTIYTASSGKNVTLSQRVSDANHIPVYNDGSQAELLAGSGIQDGVLVANIKCSNCQSWASGTMNFSDNSTEWIWAAKKGPVLASDDTRLALSTHDDDNYGTFQFDFSAKGGEDANPFLTGHKQRVNGKHNRLVMIHGYLACFIFAVLFPSGGMMIRVMKFKRLLWAHALFQVLGYCGYVLSAALGIWLIVHEYTINISGPHAIIGLLLLAVLLAQGPIGYMHHMQYKRQGCRTQWSHLHIWIGRVIIPFGIGNGVFGFHKASESTLIQVVFGMFGTFMFIVFVGVIVYGERRRKQDIAHDTLMAITEVEEALKLETPRAPSSWSDAPTRTTSWMSGSTGRAKSHDSRMTLVEPRKSCASLTHQQQKHLSEYSMPTKPAETFGKGRSHSMPHAAPLNKRCSSIYSLQPEQEQQWGNYPGVSKRTSSMSIMTLFPIASVDDLELDPTDDTALYFAPRDNTAAVASVLPKHQQQQQQWKSVTWSSDIADPQLHKQQRSQSMSCANTFIETEDDDTPPEPPAKDSRSKSVGWPGALQYSPEEWRSRSASWPHEEVPNDVPQPSDDDYYEYRFGYGGQ